MNNNYDISKKRIMHIDTSGKLYEKKDTGIAYKIVNGSEHKGLVLSVKLKRELKRNLHIWNNYPNVYAICIYYLIEDSFKDFDVLVICEDEHINRVKKALDYLFRNSSEYKEKNILGIGDLREMTGNKKLKSYADRTAKVYRKKALKPLYRQQRGIKLNIVQINYAKILEKWKELKNAIK